MSFCAQFICSLGVLTCFSDLISFIDRCNVIYDISLYAKASEHWARCTCKFWKL